MRMPGGLPTSILAAYGHQRGSGDSLGALAYQRIREKIVRLDLPPAGVVDEGLLADELGIGLTPIRQALRRLALENLVVILPRRGTLVADLNPSDLYKLFEMRLEMEALAVRLASQRATPKQIAGMEALLSPAAVAQAKAEQPDTSAQEVLLNIDRASHLQLAEAARNEFLAATLDWLYCHVQRLWYVYLHRLPSLEGAIEEHRQIVAAVKAGDAHLAESTMRRHVSGFQSDIVERMV